MSSYPFKASMVDVYLKKTGLNFRARDSFMSQEFRRAVDKILVLHSGDHVRAQKAIFEGLKRATRAEDQTGMFFELGRTIGSYKPIDTTSTLSSPTIARIESFEGHVGRDEAQEKQIRFVLGLEPHPFKYWVERQFTSEDVWMGLELDVRTSEIFKSPGFRVYIDYITRLEPHEFVRYDKALEDVRHWSIVYSFETIPDRVIAQQLVDAGAPNDADVATTHVMEALFRDWKFKKIESPSAVSRSIAILHFRVGKPPARTTEIMDCIFRRYRESSELRDAITYDYRKRKKWHPEGCP